MGVAEGVGVGAGVVDGVGVEGGVTVGIGVEIGGVGVGVIGGACVAVGVGVGVGVELHGPVEGPWIATVIGVPFLKKLIVAFAVWGGLVESKRKLYIVPQRNAFAFWFCAKVSELQLKALLDWFWVQAALL
jgi:hypothetical protein